ncbi:hypothetical protein ACLFLC_21850 [Providencia rettgeri]
MLKCRCLTKHYQSLQSSAQDVVTASNRFSELDQASYSLSGQETDGATLTRLAADNPKSWII